MDGLTTQELKVLRYALVRVVVTPNPTNPQINKAEVNAMLEKVAKEIDRRELRVLK